MTARELVVLGTASQAPTRTRNHNGYLLRWDGEGFLFDPGEGTQRQLLLAGAPSSAVTHTWVPHFHGDQCVDLLREEVAQRRGDGARHVLDESGVLPNAPVQRRRGSRVVDRVGCRHQHAEQGEPPDNTCGHHSPVRGWAGAVAVASRAVVVPRARSSGSRHASRSRLPGVALSTLRPSSVP